MENLEAIKPIPASTCNLFRLPSFMLMSTTEDNLPPYCAGIPPLMSETFLIASEVKKEEPLTQSKNSAEFNAAFGALLDNYFHLKDGLVLSNDTIANNYAGLLISNADSLNLSGIKADTTIVETAKQFIETISAEAKGLIGETNIKEKRKSFQMISDNMYDLVRTVRYDRAKIYHEFCPMAFDDQGAFWLSQSSDIKNPYFGKKMLTCGEVKDTLNFQ